MDKKTVRITILGTGDLMNPNVPNTAFLIESGQLYDNYDFLLKEATRPSVLVDCGFSIFPQLFNLLNEERIKKISYVYITHNHMDHLGSLGQFIYYRYFKFGLNTKVYTGPLNMESLKRVLDETITKVPSVKQSISPRLLIHSPYTLNENKSILSWSIQSFRSDHCKMPSYGLFFQDYQFTITGDTDILNPDSFALKYSKVIFHDACLFPAPGSHTFIETIKTHYPDEIIKKLVLVHHGIDDKSKIPSKYRSYKFGMPGEEFFF